MSLSFTPADWDRVKAASDAWWDRTLGRPLLPLIVLPREGEGGHWFKAFQFPDKSPAELVEVWDDVLGRLRFAGDGWPGFWVNFGPGVLAEFCGCRVEADDRTVWFHPPPGHEEDEIADVTIRFSPDTPWCRRITEIKRCAVERWGGMVQVGMTDIGGNLDVVASFRPSEKLLFDLVDHPAEVERAVWEEHAAWFAAFGHFNAVLQPANPGYTAWAGIFSPTPTYMLQCDFCYMIGPDMFDRFVKPELAAACGRIDRAFYHLDGIGQLPHLDSLLEIEALDGVQWVPGDGQKPGREWVEVYEKIRAAGKLMQVCADLDGLEALADDLGRIDDITLFPQYCREHELDDKLKQLERLGVEPVVAG